MARMNFFDQQSSQMIINIFGIEFNIIDKLTAPITVIAAHGLVRTLVIDVLACCINPYLFIFAVIWLVYVAWAYFRGSPPIDMTMEYIKQNQPNLGKNLDSMADHLLEIKMYKRLPQFKHNFMRQVEKSANSIFTHQVAIRWMTFRLDQSVALFSASAVALAMIAARTMALSHMTSILLVVLTLDPFLCFSLSVRMLSELGNLHPFVSRIQQLKDEAMIQPEDDWQRPFDKELKQTDWPNNGDVNFYNVSLR